MARAHDSTPTERAGWVAQALAGAGRYGVMTALSRQIGVSRQTLYAWMATGREAMVAALSPRLDRGPAVGPAASLERAVLTLLVEGHASERGIQRALAATGMGAVSLGTIAAVIAEAQQRALGWWAQPLMPPTARARAVDELFGTQRRGAYLSLVDAHSLAVWASAGPVAADADSWALLWWQAQEQGLRWDRTVSDGGAAIRGACAQVEPGGAHARDVWHVLHRWAQTQGRLDRQVAALGAQRATVARQAARVAAGQRPRGRRPSSDVVAHATRLASATAVAEGVRYLGRELRRLLEVVVLEPRRGVLASTARQQELRALAALLAELTTAAPVALQPELQRLHQHLSDALPHLLVAPAALDAVQATAAQALGADGLALLAWAWQRRRILGPRRADLLAQLPPAWAPVADPLLRAWETTVRASSAAETWHSLLRPHLAVHRTLSAGMLALLSVWHNHRVFARGVHAGQNPLQLSGLSEAPTDWLGALGYPSAAPVPAAAITALPAAPLVAEAA